MAVALQIGVIYGNPEVTSGGNALKFYASVRIEVRRRMTHENSKGESMGIRVKAKVQPHRHLAPVRFRQSDTASLVSSSMQRQQAH